MKFIEKGRQLIHFVQNLVAFLWNFKIIFWAIHCRFKAYTFWHTYDNYIRTLHWNKNFSWIKCTLYHPFHRVCLNFTWTTSKEWFDLYRLLLYQEKKNQNKTKQNNNKNKNNENRYSVHVHCQRDNNPIGLKMSRMQCPSI